MTAPASQRVHSIEKREQKRATFHVYYLPSPKAKSLQFDPSWAETAEAAREQFEKLFKALRMNATIKHIIALDAKTPIGR